MVILVCSTQWKWEGQVRTRPRFIQNRPGQIFSSHVSIYFGDWLLHNKTQPVLHGNSSAGSSIKQHKDESYVFGLHIYPFFCFLMEGQFGCGWWNSSVRARPQKSACSLFLWKLLLMVTKLKHTKKHKLGQPSHASCSGLLGSDVVWEITSSQFFFWLMMWL